jgi:hypothetical protein
MAISGIQRPPRVATVVSALHLADGDGRGVAAGLLGRGRQLAERRVGDAVGIEVEGGGVLGIEAFDQVLGGEGAAPARAGFDVFHRRVERRGPEGPRRSRSRDAVVW